jgi:Tfp pilus assembly protein PilF
VATQKCDIDLAKKYLQVKMSAEESASFEKNLASDPQFREDFEFNKDLLDSMCIHYKSVLKGKLQDLEVSEDKPGKQLKQRYFFRLSGIAAALALMIVAVYTLWFNQPDAQEVFNQYYTPYYNIMDGAERSVDNESGHLAMRLYDQKQYKEALQVFREAIAQNPEDTVLVFYKALSHLSIAQTDAAMVDLKMVSESNHELHEAAQWYLGLAYLQKGDATNAKQLFENIKNSDSSYREQANQILGDLE